MRMYTCMRHFIHVYQMCSRPESPVPGSANFHIIFPTGIYFPYVFPAQCCLIRTKEIEVLLIILKPPKLRNIFIKITTLLAKINPAHSNFWTNPLKNSILIAIISLNNLNKGLLRLAIGQVIPVKTFAP